jgi:hypothetical protein
MNIGGSLTRVKRQYHELTKYTHKGISGVLTALPNTCSRYIANHTGNTLMNKYIFHWIFKSKEECISLMSCVYRHVKCKGKAIPLHALTGPEGSRRLRLPYFKIIST